MNIKAKETLGLRTQVRTYVRKHGLAHAARVLETYERQVSVLKTKVWNESHIVWESFQTPIFQLYKAIHGTFSKYTENIKGKHKIH